MCLRVLIGCRVGSQLGVVFLSLLLVSDVVNTGTVSNSNEGNTGTVSVCTILRVIVSAALCLT